MESEHPLSIRMAAIVGGTAYTRDGFENVAMAARPKYDYILMPSGYAEPTDAAMALFMWGGPAALLSGMAYGEEWNLSHDGKGYDPRTNIVDPLNVGGTGKPSPTLLPFYSNPERFR